MTIADLQRHARELNDTQGWHGTTPEERVLWLVTEVGELAREVLQFTATGTEESRAAGHHRLGAEMYDVVWNICDLANIVGVDLEASFANKEAVNKERIWPGATAGA